MIVREWLHEIAPAPAPPGAETGFRALTRARLVHVRRMAGAAPAARDADGLVTSLEPDAPNTQPGRALAVEDAVRGCVAALTGAR
jgi:nuclear pore complex protein Nup107